MLRLISLLLLVTLPLALGQSRYDRFALILEDPPLAQQANLARQDGRNAASADALVRIRAAQASLGELLENRNVPVTSTSARLLNAVFVRATEAQAEELRSLPGVRRVVRMLPLKRTLDKAVDLVNAPAAWSVLGGIQNAGAGVKIGILDTGIDHQHPAFQDPSLSPPAGYPRCMGTDCDYANNKIIAVRSYVDLLVWGDVPAISRPDDVSPRDRVGHGTAVASVAAGNRVTGPSGTISGVAPKAFLGNYKIFGSPGVNDVTFDDVIENALADALDDGMDIVVLPVGRGAEWGPNDRGDTCSNGGVEPCDLRAAIVENAVSAGLTVVVPAGNDGDLAFAGSRFPALSSINTPGTAPSAITVGATTNSHIFYSSVKVPGDGVSSDLQQIAGLFGDGPFPGGPFTAPMRDVGTAEPDALACNPVGTGTLTGAIALVDRGGCSFAIKISNAQQGGASAVILINDSDFVFPMTGLIGTGIPAIMIGSTDGQALRNFVAANVDRPGTLEPKLEPEDAFADDVAYFTSRGPSIRDNLIKPEIAAVGTDLYMATQQYDPNGDMWDPSRYTAAQGTSFAAPMVAGAAALAMQANPGFGPAELKSAVVNTASHKDQLADFDENGVQVPVSITAVGAGKLNADGAVRTTVVASPSTISLGVINGTLPARPLTIRNTGNAAANLVLTTEPADNRLTLSETVLNLGPGASQQITVSVNATPPAGRYEGYIVINGGAIQVRVPTLYLRGDGAPFNVVPLSGVDFVGNVDEWVDHRTFNLNFKVIDQYGVPVPNEGVQFRVAKGGGVIEEALNATDELGIAAATATLGPNPGDQEFTAELDNAPGLIVYFDGRAKLRPAINVDGAVNAGSGLIGQGLAPGSYIAIYGVNLSETFRLFPTPYLPVSLSGVSVSFDVPSLGISLPGRINFVSNTQLNVQIPWELTGLNSVFMKVSTGPITESAVYSLPLNNYSPGFFEARDPGGSGRTIIAALDFPGNNTISSNNPAIAGNIVTLYANGLGPVDNRPPSGEPTPSSPLARTVQAPTVTIGGQPAVVDFSGLSPTAIALYQLNVFVPAGLATGLHEVILTIGGVQAKAGFIYVQASPQ